MFDCDLYIEANLSTIKEIINKIKNSKFMIPIIITIIILFFLVIFTFHKMYNNYQLNKRKHLILDTIFRTAQQTDVVHNSKIIKSSLDIEFSYHMFIYIDSWDYQIFWYKYILIKGSNDFFCPLIYLTPVVNNLGVVITTEDNQNIENIIEDVPLKKWTHIAIVVKNNIIEIYLKGLLVKTITLSKLVKQNNGDLLITPYGGFSGFISKINYHPYALTAKDVYKASRQSINFSLFSPTIHNKPISKSNYDTNELDKISTESLNIISNIHSNNSLSVLNHVNKNTNEQSLLEKINKKLKNNKKQNDIHDECPDKSNAPDCPIGTLACNTNNKYCYYPDRNQMVSTYIDDNNDFCPINPNKDKKNKPYQIAGTNVWYRQANKDTYKCSNMNEK